jgi:hypothetical protein
VVRRSRQGWELRANPHPLAKAMMDLLNKT